MWPRSDGSESTRRGHDHVAGDGKRGMGVVVGKEDEGALT